MKKISPKQYVRDEVARQIEVFLAKGGEITQVAAGETGWDNKKGAIKPTKAIFDKSPETRTPLDHVAATVDARREENKKPAKKPQPSKPKEKIIYDDFGDPIRRVWVDE